MKDPWEAAIGVLTMPTGSAGEAEEEEEFLPWAQMRIFRRSDPNHSLVSFPQPCCPVLGKQFCPVRAAFEQLLEGAEMDISVDQIGQPLAPRHLVPVGFTGGPPSRTRTRKSCRGARRNVSSSPSCSVARWSRHGVQG